MMLLRDIYSRGLHIHKLSYVMLGLLCLVNYAFAGQAGVGSGIKMTAGAGDNTMPGAGGANISPAPIQMDNPELISVTSNRMVLDVVAVPEFSPPEGTYASPVVVAIECATPGAQIRYTTDGTEPTETSTLYAASVQITATTTFKAKAYLTGWESSPKATAVYTITGTVATPTFNPAASTYTAAQNVTITCNTPGAQIRYTTDETEPTETSDVYSASVEIAVTTTLKAKAYLTNWNPSPTTTGVYTITGTVAAPVFAPPAGTYTSAQNVTITCATPGAQIRYTTNGTEPTETSDVYSTPVAISVTTTLKAKAFLTNWDPSPTTTGVYTITGTVAAPVFAPLAGIYTTAQNVTITCATPGAQIRYTTNGAEPTATSTLYSTPVAIEVTTTLKAKAFLTNWDPSPTFTGVYTITGTVAAPVFAPPAGTYTSAQNVTITCATPGAQIRYTTNGTEPTETSDVYSTPVAIAVTTTLKAKAFLTNWDPSPTTTGVYTITGTVAAPVFDPLAGIYTTAQNVTITCATPGAQIRYTTNGTEPTATSTLYSTPVEIVVTTILKAKAFLTNWDPSPTTTGVYTITGTVAAPVFDPLAGIYTTAQNVTITCATPGAQIRYTTNGTEPTATSTLYSTPVEIVVTTILKAIAFLTNWDPSPTTSGVYTITGTVAAPVFDPPAGIYTTAQNITITCTTPEAQIRYTTDGTEPTATSTVHSAPVEIVETTILKAKAFLIGWDPSPTTTGVYAITGTVAAPVFDPQGNFYPTAQNVTITCTTAGAQIRYTTNGTEPTESSDVYSAPVAIAVTTILKAKAFRTNWDPSPTTTGVYTITGMVAAPVFAPPAGISTTAQNVTITCTTPGAQIRYTTDGTEPTATSTLYSTKVAITATTTLKAKAFLTNWDPSPTTTGVYTITGTVAAPVFAPPAGIYTTAQDVTITCTTLVAQIRYTTNGSEPTATSTLYTAPVAITATTTLKAKAFLTNWDTSPTTTGVYTITGTVSTPPFSVPGGLYLNSLVVTLSAEDAEDSLYYAVNEGNFAIYSEPISLTPGVYRLKAYAHRTNWNDSPVAEHVYRVVEYADTLALQWAWTFNGSTQDDYLLVGLPGAQDTPIRDFLSGKAFYDWSVYGESGTDSADLIPWSDTNFNFSPGTGYWLLSKKKVVVNQPEIANVELDDDLCFGIPVHNGWNIVSNPYVKPVLWEAVKQRNGFNTDIFAFKNGVFTPTELMMPYEAYYWLNLSEAGTLIIGYDDSPVLPKTNSNQNVIITRITELATGRSARLEMGLAAEAEDGYDAMDQYYPIRGFGTYGAYIGADKLYKDYRRSSNQSYQIFIQSNHESAYELGFELGEGFDNVLLINEFDRAVYELANRSTFVFPPHQQRYLLVTGEDDFVRDYSTPELSERVVLHPNAPNPFSKSTNIKVSLPVDAEITLKIFNTKGQLIKTLASSETQKAGNAVWNFDASTLPNGLYFYRLDWRMGTQQGREIKKMMVLR